MFVVVVEEGSLMWSWSGRWAAMFLHPAINLSLILWHLTGVQAAYGRLSVQLVAQSLIWVTFAKDDHYQVQLLCTTSKELSLLSDKHFKADDLYQLLRTHTHTHTLPARIF